MSQPLLTKKLSRSTLFKNKKKSVLSSTLSALTVRVPNSTKKVSLARGASKLANSVLRILVRFTNKSKQKLQQFVTKSSSKRWCKVTLKFIKVTLVIAVRQCPSEVSATSALNAMTMIFVKLVSLKVHIATIHSLRLERLLMLQSTSSVSTQTKPLECPSLQCTSIKLLTLTLKLKHQKYQKWFHKHLSTLFKSH